MSFTGELVWFSPPPSPTISDSEILWLKVPERPFFKESKCQSTTPYDPSKSVPKEELSLGFNTTLPTFYAPKKKIAPPYGPLINIMEDEIQLHTPPVLSTPESHIFEDPTPIPPTNNEPRLTDEEIWSVYEIERTAREINDGRWRRVALQFPDHMLGDAAKVYEALERELKRLGSRSEDLAPAKEYHGEEILETSFNALTTSGPIISEATENGHGEGSDKNITERHRLYILADTSYGACCVDEIAAEHVDAEVVVHYGRSCLSPTVRLPVIYVFTFRPLHIRDVVATFEDTYTRPEEEAERRKEEKVVLVADIVFHCHITAVKEALEQRGWKNVVAPELMHDPSSLIPNREVQISEDELKEYNVFHISDPPPALLLTLQSRIKDLHIYPTKPSSRSSSTPTKAQQNNTRMALRRRYALLTSLSTCGVFGILINTLSVRNYLATASYIKEKIARAGKKSYTFVVGKVNAAKIANFSEIGGWVMVGCWESSLIESTEFYRPIITPFELELCLMSDEERIWSGKWRADFESLQMEKSLSDPPPYSSGNMKQLAEGGQSSAIENTDAVHGGDLDSEEESEPPEFDLRTGRYVSNSRPMRQRTVPYSADTSSTAESPDQQADDTTKVLARRAKLDVATVNGAMSPGAEFLRSQRTWTGLGSDFIETEASENIEEGRSGVARGYTVGEDPDRR